MSMPRQCSEVRRLAAPWIRTTREPGEATECSKRPPDEPIVQIQGGTHESRVHLDIESDDIPAEVARLSALGAPVVAELPRWTVMQAPTGQRFCVVRVQRPGFPKSATTWESGSTWSDSA